MSVKKQECIQLPLQSLLSIQPCNNTHLKQTHLLRTQRMFYMRRVRNIKIQVNYKSMHFSKGFF